jgi:hypothetical protein
VQNGEATQFELIHKVGEGKDATTVKIQVRSRVPSFDVREELLDIDHQYDIQRLDESIKMTAAPEQLNNPEYIRENPTEVKTAIDANRELRRKKNMRTLTMAKAIVDVDSVQIKGSKITADEAVTLIESDIKDDPFWRGQDMEALGRWVDRFCGRNDIG